MYFFYFNVQKWKVYTNQQQDEAFNKVFKKTYLPTFWLIIISFYFHFLGNFIGQNMLNVRRISFYIKVLSFQIKEITEAVCTAEKRHTGFEYSFLFCIFAIALLLQLILLFEFGSVFPTGVHNLCHFQCLVEIGILFAKEPRVLSVDITQMSVTFSNDTLFLKV